MFNKIPNIDNADKNTGINVTSKSASVSRKTEKPNIPQESVEVKKEQRGENEVSQEFLNEFEQDIDLIHNVNLHFSVHQPTGRTMVRVINKETGALIREIPSKEILDLAAKLDEMIGIIFDETV